MALKIVVATRNLGKLQEIQKILLDLPLQLLSLNDFPNIPDAKEEASTYLGNARKKAEVAAIYSQTWALADDSGLEVEGLGWKPGIYSSRFAGEGASDAENIQKLLLELKKHPQKRPAVFRCTMVLRHPDGREFVGEGELWGEIGEKAQGALGFGYDPIFILRSQGKTLAELSLEEKNQISHRTQALKKIKAYLAEILKST